MGLDNEKMLASWSPKSGAEVDIQRDSGIYRGKAEIGYKDQGAGHVERHDLPGGGGAHL